MGKSGLMKIWSVELGDFRNRRYPRRSARLCTPTEYAILLGILMAGNGLKCLIGTPRLAPRRLGHRDAQGNPMQIDGLWVLTMVAPLVGPMHSLSIDFSAIAPSRDQ
jgi:hypothetical protein